MIRQYREDPDTTRWHNFPHLEKYFSTLEPPQASDPMDGWPGEAERRERAQAEEKYLRQLLSSFLQVDNLNQPTPDPTGMKSLRRDLETLERMCDHFAGVHESKGRELRAMSRQVLEKIGQWLSRA